MWCYVGHHTPKKEAAHSSETMVNIFQTSHSHCSENLKFHIKFHGQLQMAFSNIQGSSWEQVCGIGCNTEMVLSSGS